MQQFRNLLKGWLGKLLLVIFILPFAFFGIEGIFNSSGSQDVAFTVNGVEISKIEVNRGIENQRRNLKQQMGGNIDDSFLTDDMLRPRVVEGLIQKELIRQASEKEGLAVSSNLVKSYVRSLPQFQDESGEFSNDKLETLLVQANFSKARLFDAVQESMVLEQLQSGIGKTAFITKPELEHVVKLNDQKRVVSFSTLKAAPLKDSIELTEEEIEDYYQANQRQYRTEEKVKVHYVTIGLDDFAADIKVEEADIVSAYDEYVKSLDAQERRRASHVLVEINDDRSEQEALERITEVQEKLQAGESFEALANEYSDDIATAPAGGDLDFAGRGLYDGAFEDALFALQSEGDTSDIVKTEFGYHLIKLTGIEKPEAVPFDEKKAELVAELKQDLAREKLDVAIDDISRKAYESGDLQIISEDYESPVETTDFFTARGGSGVAADSDFIAAAFSDTVLNEGHNSEVVELPDNKVAVLRLAEHQPARDQSLEEVRAQVSSALLQQKMRQLAQDKAEQIVEKLKAGSELAAIAEEFDLEWKENVEITRQSGDVSRSVISTAYEMPKPTESTISAKKVSLPSGDQEIVVLNKVIEGEFDLSETEIMQAKSSASQQFGNQDFNNYVASLKDSADIEMR
ncbi:MAG: SurA N-terminal domain-containing protein [Pseudomonadota bacterium]|jgi:peptidyl-prolyl cis-trans isomerase D|nr:SurA N-terminal domain-containing protein [Pseudomonadota bacterium]